MEPMTAVEALLVLNQVNLSTEFFGPSRDRTVVHVRTVRLYYWLLLAMFDHAVEERF